MTSEKSKITATFAINREQVNESIEDAKSSLYKQLVSELNDYIYHSDNINWNEHCVNGNKSITIQIEFIEN